MYCAICEHKKRKEIEDALLDFSPETIKRVAAKYYVSEDDIYRHTVMCDPTPLKDSNEGTSDEQSSTSGFGSLAGRIKLKEVEALDEVLKENLKTFRVVNARVRDAVEQIDVYSLGKAVSKSTAELLLGLSGEVRSHLKLMVEIDRSVNGSQDDGTQGLIALANAIRGRNDDE